MMLDEPSLHRKVAAMSEHYGVSKPRALAQALGELLCAYHSRFEHLFEIAGVTGDVVPLKDFANVLEWLNWIADYHGAN